MSLSQKIKDVKFSKSVAGYASKEVDGFLGDILSSVCEAEQQLSSLRAKLDAYESRADEITKKENEAQKLLLAAKEESASIVSRAKNDANDIISAAEDEAKAFLNEAEKNAKTILAIADKKGNAIIKEASAKAESINEKTAALTKECEAFENAFRAAVAETVKRLAAIRETAPAAVGIEKEENARAEEKPVKEQTDGGDTRDYVFVGGKRIDSTEKPKEKTKRKVYDTLAVTYEGEDGFSDIQKIKKESGQKGIKNPTDF